jgi:hypothetical protein
MRQGMFDYRAEIERRIEQFVHCLKPMHDRAHKEAHGSCGIIFEERRPGNGSGNEELSEERKRAVELVSRAPRLLPGFSPPCLCVTARRIRLLICGRRNRLTVCDAPPVWGAVWLAMDGSVRGLRVLHNSQKTENAQVLRLFGCGGGPFPVRAMV